MVDYLKEPDQNAFLKLLSESLKNMTGTANQIPTSMFAPPAIRPFVSNKANNVLGDTFIKPTQTLAEDASYGMPLYSGKGMTFRPDERFIDAAGLVTPAIKPAATVAKNIGKAGIKEILGQIESGTGIVGRNVVDPRMYAYKEGTIDKPHALSGTVFDREYIGGLAEKKPLNLEEHLGSSILFNPYDLSSRNYRITSVSEKPVDIITHGGQDYGRDIKHMEKGIGGASNEEIAKRVRDREQIAIQENLAQGGTGKILHMPTTMGHGSENFSVMPTDVLMQILDSNKLSKAQIKGLDESIRNYPIRKKVGDTYKVTTPFQDFKGVKTEQGRSQLYTGEGLGSTAGELRKALVDRFSMTQNQKMLGYNIEDLIAAIQDPALRGTPKGYAGNTVMIGSEGGMKLMPSANPTYNTDWTSMYGGTLGANIPVDVIAKPKFDELAKIFHGKKADLRNMTLGALEKRKADVAQIVDEPLIERVNQWKADQIKKGLL